MLFVDGKEMFSRFHFLIFTLCLLPVFSGCTPEANREATKLKSASDVEISVGESSPAEEDSEETIDEPNTTPPAPVKKDKDKVAVEEKTESPTDQKMATAIAKPKEKVAPQAKSENSYTGPAKFFGRVTVSGKAPELPPLLAKGGATKDPLCAEMAVPNQSVVVSEDGGLANVFVYMKKAPRKGVPEPSGEKDEIDQVGCVFIPHAKIIRVGQPVNLKNSDSVAHNVNVKAFQEAYNNVVPPNGEVEHTFRFAERLPASTGCDFHTFMSAWVLPVEHPWAAITDKDGRFEILNLPEGSWDFIVWHEKVGYVERAVEVKAAANKSIEMNFEVSASKLSQ